MARPKPHKDRFRLRGTRAGPLCLALSLASLACATAPDTLLREARDEARVQALADALDSLPGASDSVEARRLARAVLDATARLASEYRPLRPPQLGNFAFHAGLRERALCCHWVQDLLASLVAVELPSFQLRWVVAHYGSRLREHSALLVVAGDRTVRDGLVLDAWRDSGRLHWTRPETDRYPWRLHPYDHERLRLPCE